MPLIFFCGSFSASCPLMVSCIIEELLGLEVPVSSFSAEELDFFSSVSSEPAEEEPFELEETISESSALDEESEEQAKSEKNAPIKAIASIELNLPNILMGSNINKKVLFKTYF